MTSPSSREEGSLFLDFDPGMDQALAALRESTVEPPAQSSSRLEIGVIRRWRLERDLTSLRWWMPALGAAAAAAAVMLALLQFSSDPSAGSSPSSQSSSEWPTYTESGD